MVVSVADRLGRRRQGFFAVTISFGLLAVM